MIRQPFPACLVLAVIVLVAFATPAAADRPPNVILILIDDMGLTDLGCYGSRYHRSTHLDNFAQPIAPRCARTAV